MEDGSGNGTAASRKAGWLGGLPPVLRPAQELARAILQRYAPSLPAPAPASTVTRPTTAPDGRPLPPDGSLPPPRPSQRIEAPAPRPATGKAAETAPPAAQSAPLRDASGRPLPPSGVAPQRPQPAPRTSRSTAARPVHTASRVPGAPLSPGDTPTAPPGHDYRARPVAAPAGEFLFDVRCSCGAARLVPVKAEALRTAAEHGLAAAAAIDVAVQDALDEMHRAP
jgi:hypothetical protein